VQINDEELFDDAESVDDLDFGQLLSVNDDGNAAASSSKPGGDGVSSSSWESGVMQVRTLDWLDSLQRMGPSGATLLGSESAASGSSQQASGAAAAASEEKLDPKTFYANDLLRMDAEWTLPGDMPPGVDVSVQYERIIGTDLIYEPMHARLVAGGRHAHSQPSQQSVRGGACATERARSNQQGSLKVSLAGRKIMRVASC